MAARRELRQGSIVTVPRMPLVILNTIVAAGMAVPFRQAELVTVCVEVAVNRRRIAALPSPESTHSITPTVFTGMFMRSGKPPTLWRDFDGHRRAADEGDALDHIGIERASSRDGGVFRCNFQTARGYGSAFSRHEVPESCLSFHPLR